MSWGLSSIEVKLTPEQKEILLNDSTTYWKKYDVRLLRIVYDAHPLDCCVVEHKILLNGMDKPQFNFAYTMTEKKAKELLGNDIFNF